MSGEINILLTAQSDIDGRMVRSVTNLKKMAKITLHAVKTREERREKRREQEGVVALQFLHVYRSAEVKGDTVEEFSRIYNAIISTVNGQESIEKPINSHGFGFFNHFIIELFDPKTRLEWESYTNDSDLPAYDTLMDFITI